VQQVQRWSSHEHSVVAVNCPSIVKEYNKFMGGVDLSDMLLSIYRIDRRSSKWYLRIVFYVLGVAVAFVPPPSEAEISWEKRHATHGISAA